MPDCLPLIVPVHDTAVNNAIGLLKACHGLGCRLKGYRRYENFWIFLCVMGK